MIIKAVIVSVDKEKKESRAMYRTVSPLPGLARHIVQRMFVTLPFVGKIGEFVYLDANKLNKNEGNGAQEG